MALLKHQNSGTEQGSRRVAIVGGGLAGMSAANRLHELATEGGLPVEIALFEAGSELGGIVGTEQIDGYLVDVGADSFLTNKPGAVDLCRRLGLEDRLIPTDSRFRGALVLYDGRPVPVPEGFQLLSPTAIWPVITSPLFTVWGKVRLLLEWFVPPRDGAANFGEKTICMQTGAKPNVLDESVADFVRRRFGNEALTRLIQPLVGGIYTSDPERLSLGATMPRFLEMEREYGSLIRAALHERSRKASMGHRASSNDDREQDSSSGARYGLFAGLRGGMQDLVDALRKRVDECCTVHRTTTVTSIESLDDEHQKSTSRSSYRLTFADGTYEDFSAVVLATTASAMSNLVRLMDPELSRELGGIEYASSALVISGHRLADVRDPLQAFGLVIPHAERRRILAVSFSSRKFPERAPAGRVLLRTFVGGALQPELFNLPDDRLMSLVRGELADLLGVCGEPDFMRVYRYPSAMPQYHVGHLDRVERIESKMRQHRDLAIAGIALRGVGLPDAISSGERAAESIFETALRI